MIDNGYTHSNLIEDATFQINMESIKEILLPDDSLPIIAVLQVPTNKPHPQ